MKRGEDILVNLCIVLFFTLLGFCSYSPTARAFELTQNNSFEIIDAGISLYAKNLSAYEKSEFISEINSTFGFDISPEDLGNRSVSEEKKRRIWELIKINQKKVVRERELEKIKEIEEFQNSTVYKKKLFYNNITYYLDSIESWEREKIIDELNSKYNINLDKGSLYSLVNEKEENSEIAEKIIAELRSRIKLIDERKAGDFKSIISIEEFILNKEDIIKMSGKNITLNITDYNGHKVVEIDSNNIKAKSVMNLSISPSADEGYVLRAQLPSGRNSALKLMPDDAAQIASKNIGWEQCEKCSIELKEKTINGKDRAVYQIKNKINSKLLFLLNKKMEIDTFIDAETSQLISTNGPWWSFLARRDK